MQRIHLAIKSTVVLFCIGACATADASTMTAIGFSSTIDLGNSNNFNFDLGYTFQTNQAIEVTSLGFYDSPANVTTNSEVVSLYNSDDQLIASTTVTNSDTLSNEFLFNSIIPISLAAGQEYSILTTTNFNYYSGASLASNLTVASAITLGGGLEGVGEGSGTSAYLGPNFQFSPASVPEPSSLVLSGTGVLLIVGYRRRRRSERA
jgi:Domain of unknown function (DUF4082)/PEP-CTERM motif